MEDISGQAFGRITVIGFHGKKGREYMYDCICSCGNKVTINGWSLKSGKTQSCGCLHREAITLHGASNTKEFNVWYGMIRRCTDEKHDSYKRYGQRGISVSPDWLLFENFLRDMGMVPDGKTLDRVDNNANYGRENCRWATTGEQASNRSNNVRIEYEGESYTCSELARKFNLAPSTLWQRIVSLKWPLDKALRTPLQNHKPSTGTQ